MKQFYSLIAAMAISLSLFSCTPGSYAPRIIFEPSPNNSVEYYYKNGIPIVTADIDSLKLKLSMYYDTIDGNHFFVVWIMCYNPTSKIFLLDPKEFIYMQAFDRPVTEAEFNHDTTAKKEFMVLPYPPSKILSQLNNSKNTTIFLQALAGALRASSYHTETGYEMAQLRTQGIVQSTADAYNSEMNSVNSMVLRRNTLFPNAEVQGLIYFKLTHAQGTKFDATRYYPVVCLKANDKQLKIFMKAFPEDF